MRLKKICFTSTISWPLVVYMGPNIKKISSYCNVTVVADEVSDIFFRQYFVGLNQKQLCIRRNISIFYDCLSLIQLWDYFRKGNFYCIHSIMPKSGLISMLAAAMAGVPVRFHTFTGQVWVHKTGLVRYFLMIMDWLTASLATHVLADSPSQRDFLVLNKIVKSEKIKVLADGSVCGVDLCRFSMNSLARAYVRSSLGIKSSDFVFLFLGRLTLEKGVSDLISAFKNIAHRNLSVHLLLVGPDEGGYDEYINSLDDDLKKLIHRVGFTVTPEDYMSAADVICLPSYREGFGNVLIEAASVGLPVIASNIYGITDSVEDGVTGYLHAPGDIESISTLMFRMLSSENLRKKMGAAGRDRAVREFSVDRVTEAFREFYLEHGAFETSHQ